MNREFIAVIAVGGIDPGGGAGLAADVGFLHRFGVRAGVVTTALTVQDDSGVHLVEPVTGELFRRQLESAVRVLGPALRAIKTGLVVHRAQAEAVARVVAETGLPLVVDPLLAAGTGERFSREPPRQLFEPLLERATIVLPNIAEAEALAGRAWKRTNADLLELARELAGPERIAAVSGGHAGGETVALALAGAGQARVVMAGRRPGEETHGTGCALAAATAGFIARGREPSAAAASAHLLVASSILAATGIPGRRLSPEPWSGGGRSPCEF